MADNTTLNPGAAGDSVRDLDRLGAGVKTQVVQLDFGGGKANPESLASPDNPVPVREASMADLLDVMQQILAKIDPLSDDYLPGTSIEAGAGGVPFAQDPDSGANVVTQAVKNFIGLLTVASAANAFHFDTGGYSNLAVSAYAGSGGSPALVLEGFINGSWVLVSPNIVGSGPSSNIAMSATTLTQFSSPTYGFQRMRVRAAVIGNALMLMCQLNNVPVALGTVNAAVAGTAAVNLTSLNSSTPGTLGTTTSTNTGVALITASFSGAYSANADVSSAARTVSGNSGTINDSTGGAIGATITVSAVSGTTPTLDIVLQESLDGGTTWDDIWHCERLTTAASTRVPSLPINGRRRWVWTIGGTTPSFTFGIGATRGGSHPYARQLQFIERSLAIATNSSLGSLIFSTNGLTKASIVAKHSSIITSAPSFGLISYHDSNDSSVANYVEGASVSCAVGTTFSSFYSQQSYLYQRYSQLKVNAGVAGNTLTFAAVCFKE